MSVPSTDTTFATGAAPLAPPRPPLLVLGMHRSGTSFLTGTLQAAGLDLGEPSTSDPHNRKGNREVRALMMFHEGMLRARGHAWDDPPPGPVLWTEAERQEAGRLVAWAGTAPWGFKDPRTLLLLDGWLGLFPEAGFVGIFRHPVAVARSIQARNRHAPERSWDIWAAYNARLLALHQRRPFPLLCFDEEAGALHARLDRLLPSLGLAPLRGREAFFAPELKHHEAAAEPVPERLRPLWDALQARRC